MISLKRRAGLHNAKGQHGIGNLLKSSDVRAFDIVDIAATLIAVSQTAFMDRVHNVLEHLLQLGFFPSAAARVLAHFEARNRDAAGIGGLARGKQDFGRLEQMNAVKVGGHIGPFGNGGAAIGHQHLGIITQQFVLSGAGQGDIA